MVIIETPTKDDEDEESSSSESIMDYSLITEATDLALQQGLARPSRGNPSILEIPSSLLANISSDAGEGGHLPLGENTTIRVGNILSLLPMSAGGGLVDSKILTMSTTAYMAMQDFNNRQSPFWKDNDVTQQNSQLESQLELLRGCDFYLSMSFRDNELSATMTGRRWMEEFFPPQQERERAQQRERAPRIQSYAVLGTIRSATSTTAALLGAVTGPKNYSSSTWSCTSDGTGGTAADYGIPTISSSATSSALDKKLEYPYFGRTTPTNRGEAAAFCFYLQSIGVKHFAIIHVNDSFGTAYMASLFEAATQRYQMQVSIASYRDYDEQSLQNAIEQLKAENTRFVFAILPAGFWRESVLALYDADLMGEDREWFFAESLATAQGTVLDLTNERDLDLAKAINRTAGISLRDYDSEVRILGSLMNQFAATDAAVDHFLASQRSGFLSFEEAQHHNESEVGMQNQDIFRQFLTTAAFPNPSTYALFTYDAIWALGLATCQANPSQTMGPQLFESFKELQFIGASGNVTFDPHTGTRDASGMNYQIVNLMTIPVQTQETSETSVKITPVVSTVINLGKSTATVERPLIFADGTTAIPSPLQPVDEELNLVPNSVRAVCWSLSGLVMICSVFFTIWTYQRRKFPRVRASQPIFLVVLCVGAFFMGLSIIFLTFQEPIPKSVLDAACMAEVWLLSLGFSTTFAALFAKTWRIHTVYQHARSCRRVQIKAKDVLWPFAIVFTLNFIILTAWTIVDPLEWHRVPMETNQFGQVEESRGTCMAFGKRGDDSGTTTTHTPAFFWCLIAVDGCAFFISTIESYRARNLPSEFNETFYVWITNLIILECLFISIPVLFLVDEDPSAHMIAQSLIATVFALAVLIPMFLPKMPRVLGTGDGGGSGGRPRRLSSRPNTETREPSSRSKNFSAMQKISQYAVDVVRGEPSTAE